MYKKKKKKPEKILRKDLTQTACSLLFKKTWNALHFTADQHPSIHKNWRESKLIPHYYIRYTAGSGGKSESILLILLEVSVRTSDFRLFMLMCYSHCNIFSGRCFWNSNGITERKRWYLNQLLRSKILPPGHRNPVLHSGYHLEMMQPCNRYTYIYAHRTKPSSIGFAFLEHK